MIRLLILFLLLSAVKCEKPNIVLFLTDDQDIVLDGMVPMQNVQKLIASQGATYTNSFVASPICCPSRASILSGKYPHNHETYKNNLEGGCYGRKWRENEKQTFGAILNKNGYKTFYAGKYLNEYGTKRAGGPGVVPPGWTEWHGLVGNSVYYNFTMSNNGIPTQSFNRQYLTDLVNHLGVSFINNQLRDKPFLMVLAPPAPHQPFTPASRHLGKFSNVTAKKGPTFNLKPDDKHWLMNMPPSPLPNKMLPSLDKAFRRRWETLLSVDEMVKNIVTALKKNGMFDNTYLIFTSDNGYHIGQFSQVYDKRQPYETDIRVPLLMSGPQIGANITIASPVINVDIAPTILALAGIEVPPSMDGLPIPIDEVTFLERNLLVEYYGENSTHTVSASCPWKYDVELAECLPLYDCKCQDSRNNTYGCVRYLHPEVNIKYCLFNDTDNFEEMYDLNEDPHEIENLAQSVLPSVRYHYSKMLKNLLRCKGSKECTIPKVFYYEPEVVVV